MSSSLREDGKVQETWRATNEFLCATTEGLGYRKSKEYGDQVANTRLNWESSIVGVDEGDWVCVSKSRALSKEDTTAKLEAKQENLEAKPEAKPEPSAEEVAREIVESEMQKTKGKKRKKAEDVATWKRVRREERMHTKLERNLEEYQRYLKDLQLQGEQKKQREMERALASFRSFLPNQLIPARKTETSKSVVSVAQATQTVGVRGQAPKESEGSGLSPRNEEEEDVFATQASAVELVEREVLKLNKQVEHQKNLSEGLRGELSWLRNSIDHARM